MYKFHSVPSKLRFRKHAIASFSSKIEKPTTKEESPRMKEFHERLKLDKLPRIKPSVPFVNLETNPKNNEHIPDSEKNPIKYGDWQHGGRVTDF